MKLLRHGEFGNEKPGIIDHEGKIRDLSSHIPDINGDSINSESLKKLVLLICLLYQSFRMILD